MKLTCKEHVARVATVLSLIFLFQQVNGKAFSQQITFSGRNVALKDVFSSVKEQTGYVFFYRNSDISSSRPVTIHLKSEPLHSALDSIFKQQPLDYHVEGNTVIVTRKAGKIVEPAGTSPSSYAYSPSLLNKVVFESSEFRIPELLQVHISGTVKDKDGNPVAGASIEVRHKKAGTTTDNEGRFSLDVDPGSTVRISSIGFRTQEFKVEKSREYHIILEKTVSELNEVVVVAYGTEKKSTMTGSVSTLSSKTYTNAPRDNVMQAMQGNVPGVEIASGSGEPNSVGDVRIRGLGSINAGRGPLYVIDGIPSSVSVSGLNPDDIESVSVLKDAAASSIYGSRAANGVIIITTKKGVRGKTKFSASVLQGINKLAVSDREKVLNSSEMIELLREGWINAGKDPSLFVDEIEKNDVDTTLNTDWYNALIRTGHFGQYHLSASGGGEHSNYYLSGSYMQSEAPQRGDQYKRGNIQANVSGETKRVSFNGMVMGYFDQSNSVPTAGSLESPIRAFYRTQPWIPIFNPDGSYNTGYNGTHNVVGELALNKRPHTGFHGTTQGNVIYRIIPGLTFETSESFTLSFDRDDTWYNPYFGSGRHNGGERDMSSSYEKSWTATNLLRYKNTFDKVHSIEVFGGYEAQKNYGQDVSGEAEDFIPGLEDIDAAALVTDLSTSTSSNSIVGAFVNGRYNFNNEFFASASFRRDGSSRFGSERRYGNFWSVGAGWNLHKTLLSSVSFISDLKLRASYGTNGNQDIGNNDARGLYSSGDNYDGSTGALLGRYANAFLTWEVNKPFDVGVDFGFFNSRLNGSFDYYNRVTSKLLLDVPLPMTTGLDSYTDNYGSLRNSGVEITLQSRNIISPRPQGFEWGTNFNISINKNRITKIPSPLTTSTYLREIGTDYYTFYMPGYAGVDPQTGEALWYSSVDKSTTTNDYSKAVSIIDGSANPKFFGGLTNTFSYHHFSFSFMFYFKWGSRVFDEWGGDTNSDGTKGFDAMGKMSRYEYENRWQKPGDITNVPKIVYKGKQNSNAKSTRWVYDGSYVRLQDIELSYSLPSQTAHALKISDARIFFRANNMLTYVKDKALIMDPEVYSDGELDQYAPKYKTVTLGLNINF